jgi:hypothetical protein
MSAPTVKAVDLGREETAAALRSGQFDSPPQVIQLCAVGGALLAVAEVLGASQRLRGAARIAGAEVGAGEGGVETVFVRVQADRATVMPDRRRVIAGAFVLDGLQDLIERVPPLDGFQALAELGLAPTVALPVRQPRHVEQRARFVRLQGQRPFVGVFGGARVAVAKADHARSCSSAAHAMDPSCRAVAMYCAADSGCLRASSSTARLL